MKFLKAASLCLCVAAICACNKTGNSRDAISQLTLASPKEEEQNKSLPPQQENADTGRSMNKGIPPQQQINGIANADWDKKIIKTAAINLEIKNYRSFTELMRDNIKKFGGYVAQEEQNQSDYKIENNVSIKVPVDQFDNLITELTKDQEKLLKRKLHRKM